MEKSKSGRGRGFGFGRASKAVWAGFKRALPALEMGSGWDDCPLFSTGWRVPSRFFVFAAVDSGGRVVECGCSEQIVKDLSASRFVWSFLFFASAVADFVCAVAVVPDGCIDDLRSKSTRCGLGKIR